MYCLTRDLQANGRKISKAFMAVLCSHNMSTASTEAKPEIVSKNITFRPAFDSPIREENRPMVLIYSWLLAKAKHMHKYGDFYLGKGYDVVHIKVEPMQLLLPNNAQDVVQHMIDFVDDAVRRLQPILIHGFSVGGYLYGETLVKMLGNQEKYKGLTDRIKAQIFDSPVDIQGIPKGVSQASTDNVLMQKVLQGSIASYLKLTSGITMKHYMKSSSAFTTNELRTPSLLLYSNSDPVGEASRIEEVGSDWKAKGIPTDMQCFKDSAHVSHYQMYPVDYTYAVNSFIEKIGLTQEMRGIKQAAKA